VVSPDISLDCPRRLQGLVKLQVAFARREKKPDRQIKDDRPMREEKKGLEEDKKSDTKTKPDKKVPAVLYHNRTAKTEMRGSRAGGKEGLADGLNETSA